MTKLSHSLECGHELVEDKGNSASPRQNVFCTPCRGHMSVVRTQEYERSDDFTDGHSEGATVIGSIVLDISEDETPEIHEEIQKIEEDDDAPL